jgi:hypothetical protein
MTKMKRKIVLLGILLMILGIMGIGCYTVFTHTRVQGEEGEAEYTGQYYREHCTDCHQDYHNFPYGFYYGYYPDYYWSNPRWGHYYAYPWWWDRYWGDDYYYDEGGVTEPESAEKAERRRGLMPPYVNPGGGTPSVPFINLPPTQGTQPTEVKEEGKVTPTKIETKQEQKKEDESKEKKAPRRRTE